MSISTVEREVTIVDVNVTTDELIATMSDGRDIRLPLSWYPRLMHGTDAERQNWQLWGNGYAIEWPDLDEHIGPKGLAAGNRSGESAKSLERWLDNRQKPPPPPASRD